MILKELISELEKFAPLHYQESYDNSGLLVGNFELSVNAALLTLDVTEAVVDEAIEKGCNLIIAHHPIIFSGLKKLNGKNYVERTVIKAIKNDVAIYAAHTNLDNVFGGVNFKIAEKLKLKNVSTLSSKKQTLNKLTFFVPVNATGRVLNVIHASGAGKIGNYSECSFAVNGKGRFRPEASANPTTGKISERSEEDEDRVEVIFPNYLSRSILEAMKSVHPYEEVAYYLQTLENINQHVGGGAVGTLGSPMAINDFLNHIKKNLAATVIRHTGLVKQEISKVAVCGGSGSFMLRDAIASGADIFITADFKYHEFFDAEEKIIIADIGHFESEQFTKELFKDIICQKFPNFATYLSEVNTNPVQYFY
jgi:dinuclear metal center YbgI/SA1388 family protein